MDRLLPVRKDRPIRFALPSVDRVEDLTKATGALLSAVAAGELTPSEAAELARLVDSHVKAIEATDLHMRLSRLEEGRS
jgi:DNA-binding GntR family transcriptional regulator